MHSNISHRKLEIFKVVSTLRIAKEGVHLIDREGINVTLNWYTGPQKLNPYIFLRTMSL